jgi:hypothetical protein
MINMTNIIIVINIIKAEVKVEVIAKVEEIEINIKIEI